jgi:hypothetical protein
MFCIYGNGLNASYPGGSEVAAAGVIRLDLHFGKGDLKLPLSEDLACVIDDFPRKVIVAANNQNLFCRMLSEKKCAKADRANPGLEMSRR